MVQFQLLHSKFHLCSVATRQLMLSSYIKFINLFPEIKPQVQQVSMLYDFKCISFVLVIFLHTAAHIIDHAYSQVPLSLGSGCFVRLVVAVLILGIRQ